MQGPLKCMAATLVGIATARHRCLEFAVCVFLYKIMSSKVIAASLVLTLKD